MKENPFFHSFQFNCSLIVMFFMICAAVTFAILPALGLHRLGTKVSDELSQYSAPPARNAHPAVRPPSNPDHGIPVAMQTRGEAR